MVFIYVKYRPQTLHAVLIISCIIALIWFLGAGSRSVFSAQTGSDLVVDPSALDISLLPQSSVTETLRIQNNGAFSLTYQITPYEAESAWQPLLFPDQKIEPGLLAEVGSAASSQATVLVYLREQADLNPAYLLADRDEKGRFVVETLRATALDSQQELLSYLQSQVEAGTVSSYQPHYIVNAVLVTGDLAVVPGIAAHHSTAYIEAAGTLALPQPVVEENSLQATEWGIARINADDVWNTLGISGQGIVVANIDTGVLATHAALANQYRGAATGSHDYNWFDPTGIYPSAPGDNNGHGTHTMGTMVGDDGSANQIGVAPGAQWIAAKGCATNSCSSAHLLAAAEWILAPYPIGQGADQGDPSRRPHVVNSSWGGSSGDLWFSAAVNAWRAAGIFPAFSAGNAGPGAGSVLSPADYAASFASGATQSDDSIASFSSRGPSSLTTETKPDLAAPGASVRSAWNNGGYATASGTSMASPHTAGCAALLLSANPTLSLTQIEQLLTGNAHDLGAAGADDLFGHGLLDCFAAITAQPTPSWLSIQPEAGVIGSGATQDIAVSVNSAGLTPDVYYALLTITSDEPTQPIIHVPVTLTVTESSSPPVANFFANPQGGFIPLSVSFTDQSTGTVDSWLWHFGDGQSSLQQHPVHTYTVSGDYTVSLSVSGSVGSDVLTRTNIISMTEAPPPVDVSIPTTLTAPIGGRVSVPVLVDTDVTGRGIIAYQFGLGYDPDLLEVDGFTVDDTLSAGWSASENTDTPGEIRLVAYGSAPLAGMGQLVTIHFNVNGPANVPSDLTLVDYLFNEGWPVAQVTDGSFSATALEISGAIHYQGDVARPVGDVQMSLTGAASDAVDSLVDGNYRFDIDQLGDYTVTPAKPDDASPVSALDASYIAQCAISATPQEQCTLEASDVSGDGQILAYDAALIARHLVGLDDPSSQVGAWVFSPPARQYPSLLEHHEGDDYAAYLVGDVTGNWAAASASLASDSRIDATVTVSLPQLRAEPGEIIEAPLTVSALTDFSLLGFQTSIAYDPSLLEFVAAEQTSVADGIWTLVHSSTPDGRVRLAGYGVAPLDTPEQLVLIRFRAIGQAGTRSPLRLEQMILNEGTPSAQRIAGSVELSDVTRLFVPYVNR